MCNMTGNASKNSKNTGYDHVKQKPLPTIPPYGPNAIEVQNLTFSYRSTGGTSIVDDGSQNKNAVLKNLNLSLPTGSRCLLIGANGSGTHVV